MRKVTTHLVRELWRLSDLFAIAAPARPRFSDPIGEMADKIEEEVPFGHGNHFIRDFHKEGKTLGIFEIQPA